MTVLQLIDGSTCSLREQLVTHTDTADRFATCTNLLADDIDGILTHIRVARTVGKEQAIEVHVGVIVVPRYTDYLYTSINKATDDVSLHTAVNEHNFLAGTLVVADNLLAAHLVNEVHSLVVSLWDVVWLIVEDDLTHHHTMLTKHLSQLTGIDTCDSWHFLTLQPIGKTLHSIPVAILLAVVAHDDGRSVDLVALHEGRQTICLEGEWRHTVVAYEWEGKCH